MIEHESDFEGGAFLDLLGEVMMQHGTGVVSIQVHIPEGVPWAVGVQFNNAAKKAA